MKKDDDNKKLNDPNYYARRKSQQMWVRYLSGSKKTAAWILACNFFFGVLPGILYFVSNVRISQEENKKLTNILPDFNRVVNIFGILFVIIPMVASIFQMSKLYRFISLRMTRTFFVGQLVGFVFYMCSFSKTFLEKFHWFPKKTTFTGLVIIMVLLVMLTIFLPYLFWFSEMVDYHFPKTQTQLLWEQKVRSSQCLEQIYKKLK